MAPLRILAFSDLHAEEEALDRNAIGFVSGDQLLHFLVNFRESFLGGILGGSKNAAARHVREFIALLSDQSVTCRRCSGVNA